MLLVCMLSMTAVRSVAADTGRVDTRGAVSSRQSNMPARDTVKVAVGYCIDRCYRQAEICRFREQSHEHCRRQLVNCLAAC
jgi:nuclear transport factor 2 (NTF2) superfamily protein